MFTQAMYLFTHMYMYQVVQYHYQTDAELQPCLG